MAAAKKKKVIEFPGDAPTGKKRTFRMMIARTVDVTLDTSVIAQGLMPDNPIFGSRLDGGAYDEKIVLEHLAFNLIGNNLALSAIEGYANCPDESADVPWEPWEVDDIREIKTLAKKRSK